MWFRLGFQGKGQPSLQDEEGRRGPKRTGQGGRLHGDTAWGMETGVCHLSCDVGKTLSWHDNNLSHTKLQSRVPRNSLENLLILTTQKGTAVTGLLTAVTGLLTAVTGLLTAVTGLLTAVTGLLIAVTGNAVTASADIMLFDDGQQSEKVKDGVCAGFPKTLILAVSVFIV